MEAPPSTTDAASRRCAPAAGLAPGARALAVLHAVFLISGFCALVYQVAWQRMLGLFGGSDAVAATIVVGTFLLGLGLGSLAGGMVADRLSRARAVVAFGACEIGIALCAAASPYLFYDVIFGQLLGLARSQLAVLGVIFAALLLPTLLMGLSLPLLSRAVVRDVDGAAERIGWLYAVNTFGAGAGALIAGTVLLGTVGYEVTVWLGALLNGAVGTAALLVARGLPAGEAMAASERRDAPVPAMPGRLLGWCALVFASGFLIISLEIVWFRVLGTLAATNAYAFSIVLAVFLIADAAGILAGARVVRRVADPRRFFLRLQGAVALYALGTLALLWAAHTIPEVTQAFILGMAEEGGRRSLLVSGIAWLAVTVVVVAPPAFLLGMSFPIAQKAVQKDRGLIGLRVGVVQLANIVGNTAGAVVTGLVLLDLLGTAGTLRAIGVLGLLLAALAFLAPGQPRPRAGDVVAGAALLALVVFFPGNRAFWARLHALPPGPAGVAVVGEDRTGVVVMRPGRDGAWMFIGGHTQSRLPFLPVHGTLGALGPLVHPEPRSMLVIGHAIGGTPYAAALAAADPAARVRVIEIVAPVYEVVEAHAAQPDPAAAPLRAMLADTRIERRVGDGRHALSADNTRYDVIQADAMLPRSAHSGLLYSVEFFRQMRGRLAPGGIAVQWAPTSRSEASFLAAFPHVVRLEETTPGASETAVLIGSADGPVPFDRATLAQRLATVEPALEAAGWPAATLRNLMLSAPVSVFGPGDLRPADMNTDLFPKDEYFLNRWKLDVPGRRAPRSAIR